MHKPLVGLLILAAIAFLFGKFWLWCMDEIKKERQNYTEYKQSEYDNIIVSPYDINGKHLSFYKKKLKTLCVRPNLKTKYVKDEMVVKNGKLDMRDICDYPYEPVFTTDLRVIIDEPKTVFKLKPETENYGIDYPIVLNKTPNSFKLSYECEPAATECSYSLEYKRDKATQVLKTQTFKNNYELDLRQVATINWAGDINNDELLDFLVTYKLSDGKYVLELYTSPKYSDEPSYELVELKRYMEINGY